MHQGLGVNGAGAVKEKGEREEEVLWKAMADDNYRKMKSHTFYV